MSDETTLACNLHEPPCIYDAASGERLTRPDPVTDPTALRDAARYAASQAIPTHAAGSGSNRQRIAHVCADAALDAVLALIPSPHPQGGTAALRALSEAATPGEWHAYLTIHAESWIVTDPLRAGFTTVAQIATGADDYGKANGEFIAAAVNYVRALLAAAPAPTEAGDE